MEKNYFKIIDCDDYTKIAVPDDFISLLKGKRKAILKPNISTKTPVSYTHPLLVKAFADYLSDHGIDVTIAEGMHLKKFSEAILDATGYSRICGKGKYRFTDLEKEHSQKLDLKNCELQSIAMPKIFLDEDTAVINMPKLKTHIMTLITGPVKNVSMGMVNQNTRARMHRLAGNDFPLLVKILTEAYLRVKDRINITVVDAVEIMVGDGPNSGVKFDMNKIIIGDAIDAEFACASMMNFNDSPFCAHLQSVGLNPSAAMPESGLDLLRPNTYNGRKIKWYANIFNIEYWASILLGNRTVSSDWYKLMTDRKKCIECGECRAHCPAGAIGWDFDIDEKRCIRCLCCVENCPQNAIQLGMGRIMKIADWIGSKFY